MLVLHSLRSDALADTVARLHYIRRAKDLAHDEVLPAFIVVRMYL